MRPPASCDPEQVTGPLGASILFSERAAAAAPAHSASPRSANVTERWRRLAQPGDSLLSLPDAGIPKRKRQRTRRGGVSRAASRFPRVRRRRTRPRAYTRRPFQTVTTTACSCFTSACSYPEQAEGEGARGPGRPRRAGGDSLSGHLRSGHCGPGAGV